MLIVEIGCYAFVIVAGTLILLRACAEKPPNVKSWQCQGTAKDGGDPDGHGHCPKWRDAAVHCACSCHKRN